MTWLLWLAGIAALLGIAYGAYRLISWQSLGNLAVTIFNAIKPSLLKAVSSKNLTPEQLERNRQGKDLNLKRPDEGAHR